MKKHLVAIVGPTATGKSRLAIRLAQQFNGEIIGADSRQIYCYMDIGTAKPTPQQMAQVPHHLIDKIYPDQDFSVAVYQQLANQAIDDIFSRGKVPFLVGGSGLYVKVVLEGWGIPRVEPEPELRRELEERVAAGETAALYDELMEADPEAAGAIDPRNARRLIRALEVNRVSQAPFSAQSEKSPPSFDILTIGLTADRAELYRRIDNRVDEMMKAGLVREVQELIERGYSPELPPMSGIGYAQICDYLKGAVKLETAVYQIKTETHRLVRKQYNWFKPADSRIRWFDIAEDVEPEIARTVAAFLSA